MGIFDDILIRIHRDKQQSNYYNNRNAEILKIFGDYCESRQTDLEQFFKIICIENRQATFGDDKWVFSATFYQTEEDKRNFEGYSIRVYCSKIHVYGKYLNGEFSYNFNMNKTQLKLVMKNALRYLVRHGYKLS